MEKAQSIFFNKYTFNKKPKINCKTKKYNSKCHLKNQYIDDRDVIRI